MLSQKFNKQREDLYDVNYKNEKSMSFAQQTQELSSSPSIKYTSSKTFGPQLYKSEQSDLYNLPSQFFQSQADIRTWGADCLTDPSILPYDKSDQNLPNPFHTLVPGYTNEQAKLCTIPYRPDFYRNRQLGPELPPLPFLWLPRYTNNPMFIQQERKYDLNEVKSYQMDRLSYVNAQFHPADPTPAQMYAQMCPWTAYPYGIPQ